MDRVLPVPVQELQAVLGGAETAVRKIVAEIARVRETAQPCLPSEDFEDDATERPGVGPCSLSLDGIAQQVVTTLCESVLIELDRARRATPRDPSPESRSWVGFQALVVARAEELWEQAVANEGCS